MERGDVVEVVNWSDWWNGRIALVSSIDRNWIYIRPILGPVASDFAWVSKEGFGFKSDQLKVLGHIDVAQEGEKHANRR